MNSQKYLSLTVGLLWMSFQALSQQTLKPLIENESGDVYSTDHRYGLVLTAPDGSCYRIRVLNGGTVVSENVSCQDGALK